MSNFCLYLLFCMRSLGTSQENYTSVWGLLYFKESFCPYLNPVVPLSWAGDSQHLGGLDEVAARDSGLWLGVAAKLTGPVLSENASPLLQKLFWTPRWQRQSTRPGARLSEHGVLWECTGHTPIRPALLGVSRWFVSQGMQTNKNINLTADTLHMTGLSRGVL